MEYVGRYRHFDDVLKNNLDGGPEILSTEELW